VNSAVFQNVVSAMDAGRHEQARATLQQVLQRTPRDADANNLMSVVLVRWGKPDQAVLFARRAAAAAPQSIELRANLANVLMLSDDTAGALEEFREAVRMAPGHAGALTGLVAALSGKRLFGEAVQVGLRGLELQPVHGPLYREVAGALLNAGRARNAVEVLEEAQRRCPGVPILQQRKAAAMLYAPGFSPAEVAEAHREFGRQMQDFVRPAATPFGNTKDPSRRIRLGILSADLRSHPVAHFLMPLLEHLDRERFEVTCYHDAGVSDVTTQRIQSLSDHWHETAGLDEEQFAAAIRADSIDMLLELGGHTSRPRPATLMLRPAPVIASWLGYPSSLGLPGVDARIVDSLTDPPGEAEKLHTEALVRVDPCFLCYTPRADPVARAPQEGVVFGSFNTLQKVSDPLLALWGRLLAHVPGSRLLIKSGGLEDPVLAANVRERLGRCAIDPSSVELIGYVPTAESHLAAYAGIDIGLDTYPYCGTTTTCEALSMGVPVVSLAGKSHAARVGLSLLSAVGHPEWCAESEDEYIHKAASLASDLGGLDALRRTLPEQVRSSALCDARAFGARFGSALAELWRAWAVA
jgi:protein O-GlcNAc transferase